MKFPPIPEILNRRDLDPNDLGDIDSALLLCYAWMNLARTMDERIFQLFRQGLIQGTVTGGQGNEGLTVPLALLLDKEIDVVSWTHRDLAGHLVWGHHPGIHLNQYLANSGSPTQGREGNAHHGDPINRSYPMVSHLGTMLSNVVGGTDSQRRFGRDAVGVAIFGDGGSSTGDVHESMNLASVLNLPILFVIENNGYAYSTPTREQFAIDHLASRAAGYGMEAKILNGSDVEDCLRQLAESISEVRTTGRPMLIDAAVLRLRGHACYDTCTYLAPGEAESWVAKDPVLILRKRLAAAGKTAELNELEETLNSFFEKTAKIAIQTPRPAPGDFAADNMASTAKSISWSETPDSEELTFAQAIGRAHQKILSESPESIVMGQDIANYGGAFKVTENLFNLFGRDRILNTPLAESAMVGYATGLALNGHRPIVEFQFADFATDATTQILLNAGTYHFRSGASVPMVLRLPCGSVGLGAFHSQDLEAIYAHAPGLKILYPSTPQDAYNAMLAAYEDDNPVLLFEHKKLYRSQKGPVRFDPDFHSVWHPRKVCSGRHGTLVTYGEMVHLVKEALFTLETEYEYSFDLFDLRAIAPLDLEPIRQSLAATHRLAVIHEGRGRAGFGAELVSQLVATHFFELEAPPLRITSLDTPVPFAAELETVYRPSVDRISSSLIEWME
jgi:2-oxoisovalerate dehydrogenase E1 component